MKNVTHIVRTSLVFLAGVSMVACAPFFEDSQSWKPSPGTRIAQADLRPSIGYYENAVTAINARHYALALEYLQSARAQKPDDVRVLTAFGVVYDKLGRFDLSARYYTQAAAVEPQSKIIAADMDYSRRLQGFAAADPVPQVAQIEPKPAEEAWRQIVAESPSAPDLSMPVTPVNLLERPVSALWTATPAGIQLLPKAKLDVPVVAKAVFLTGHPLMIIDASGRIDSGKSVRSYLSGRGWTLAKGEDPKMPARTQTYIVYREPMMTAAKALARTLALPMRLTVSEDVEGLQLVLGGDISGTDLAAKVMRPQHRQLALATPSTQRQE